MAVDRRDANLKTLQETADVQDQTKEAIWRIQRQAQETEQLGHQTLDELRRQGQQMDDINHDLDSVNSKLDQSQALQTRFDRWAGNWLGGKKRAAMKEASSEIADRNREMGATVKEVFQHQKYDSVKRKWRNNGLVLCSDTSVSCEDLFDPTLAESMENSRWQIDFSLAGIDAEGWTYANNFGVLNKHGAGDSAPKWNSYVRRRKWRHVATATGGGALGEVHERNEARKAEAAQRANASKHADKIGYVPRNKQAELKESGLSSAGMMGKGGSRGTPADQQLDAESAAGLQRVKERDAEIDQGIDAIAQSIDNLGNIAGQMKDETVSQNRKLEKIEENMDRTTEKQTVVNARQRYLLK